MRVQVLGPVRAWRGGQELDLGPAGRRAVLGLLALSGGRAVPRADMVDALWGERPPSSAANVIQTHVKHLRRLFDPERHRYARSTSIPIVGDGYALRIPDCQVDLERFRDLVSAARRTGADDEAAGLLGEALELWQGRPIADHPGLTGHAKVVALLGERRNALLAYARVMIATGRAVDLLPLLAESAAAHPLDESVQALLVRAYAAAGRRADAFAAYENTRRALHDELAVGPGAELADVHASLLEEVPAGGRPHRAVPVPAQLPANAPGFAGRTAELTALDGLLADRDPASTVVIAVRGTAGVGKTALAVHWGHRVRARFPDGQLCVNLRGYGTGQPLSTADVLSRLLESLGVAGADVPVDVDARAARYRTEFADQRLLILLDNASTAEQVRLLLPGTPSCVVLVTSRDGLAGLVAVHGARRLDLKPLRQADATALLRSLIGERARAESAAVAELAGQCAFLPLPLRVAAELAACREGTALADLVRELGDRQRRLRLLDGGGDDQAAVREVLSWSCKHLPVDAARLFRALGRHPGRDFDAHCATALGDLDPDTAARLLDVLVRAHLVDRGRAGRYGMHDLLRAYAVELAAEDPPAERSAALGRLFDHYLATTAAAMDLVYPGWRAHRPTTDPPASPPATDPARTRAWLDAERHNLVDIRAFAAEQCRPEHAMRLAEVLYRYLEAGYHSEALAVHTTGLRAARQIGDRDGEARALTNLGAVHRLLGRYGPAAPVAAAAPRPGRPARRGTGAVPPRDRRGQARGHRRRRRPPRAGTRAVPRVGRPARHGRRADQPRDRAEPAGDYAAAAEALTAGRALFRELGDRGGEASALTNLGEADMHRGRHTAAAGHLREALAHFRDLGHRYEQAAALSNLGQVHVCLGLPEEAITMHEEALAIFRATGHRYGEANTLNGLAEALHAAGRADALAAHTAALAIAEDTGDHDERTRAAAGIARCGGRVDRAAERRG